ncbi:MAG: dethiobiotin synthase [Pseudomonadota bacterium]|nr:dethiobiotin synthase [Pseudomonadota bacterium]
MIKVFITGTGTGVGKTYVTCNLINILRKAGKSVVGLKPVISGYSEDEIERSDTACILTALGLGPEPHNIQRVSPWRFQEPISPDMAAARENREIDFLELVKWTSGASDEADFNLVEGVGGIMVPLSQAYTVLDWVVALDFPVLLVGGSYLGSLSHTLSSVDVLRSRGVEVLAVIISESQEQPVPMHETVKTLRNFVVDIPVIGLPRGDNMALISSELGWT